MTHGQTRLGVDVFGASYHYQTRTFVDKNGEEQTLKPVNPGFGLMVTVRDATRSTLEAHVGIYTDSVGGSTGVGGLVWQAKLGRHLRGGIAALMMVSTVDGTSAAPLPIVSYQIQRVTISALWIPSIRQYVSGAIGTFATVSIK